MPVTYHFDGCTVALRMTGLYETADVRAAFLAALAEPDRPEVAGLLFDVRGSQSLARRTADQVRTMAQFIASHADRFGRRLALVADNDVAFGLMRLASVGVEQHGVEASVFRDVAEAERWLGT